MKKFNSRPTEQITFTLGEQSITYTVTAPGLFFGSRLRSALPMPPETASDAERARYLDARVIIYAAEALRATEEGIEPLPGIDASVADWYEYAHRLGAMFEDAGFSTGMVNALFQAFTRLDAKSPTVAEAVEEQGNG